MTEIPASRRSGEGPICPWCGHLHDGTDWLDDRPHESRCEDCDKPFTVEAECSVSYRSFVTGDEKP